MISPRYPFIDPGRFDDPRELETAMCGLLFEDARHVMRNLFNDIHRRPADWHQGLDPELLAAVRRRTESTLDVVRGFLKRFEKSYLTAKEIRY